MGTGTTRVEENKYQDHNKIDDNYKIGNIKKSNASIDNTNSLMIYNTVRSHSNLRSVQAFRD